MGPLSHFNLFWAVQDSSRPGADRAAEALAPYSLLGFVLYDPKEDPSLHARLKDDWADLDELTGPNLMMIAPVDPPTAWKADPQVRDRPLMRMAADSRRLLSRPSDALSRVRNYGTLISADPSQTIVAMRSLLGIDPGMGSCLVLTRNVNSRVAWVLSTSEWTAIADIERLGSVAGQLARRTTEDRELERLLSRIAVLGGLLVERLELEEPLSAILTDICASAAAVSGNDINADRARKQLRNSLAKRTATTATVPPDRASAQLAQLAASAFLGGVALAKEGQLTSISSLTLKPTLREISPRSAELLRQGDWLFGLMQGGWMPPGHEPDFRLPIVSWSQALEYEMAELLGHSVRQGLGVRLPRYFWQHQPGLMGINIVLSPERKISFNTQAKGSLDPAAARWQPPTMGELRLGWEEWHRQAGRTSDPDLVEVLTRANQLRNPASHAGDAMPERAAIEARQCVQQGLEQLLTLGIPRWSRHAIE